MKTQLLIIFSAIFCLLVFIKCNKNDENYDIVGDIDLTADDLKICPYSGNEILIFKDSVGDSIVYKDGSRTLEVNIKDCDHLPYHDLPKAHCYFYDKSHTRFSNSTSIELYTGYDFNTKQGFKKFAITIYAPDTAYLFGICEIESGKLIQHVIDCYSLNVNFLSSIKIANKTFNSVYLFTGGGGSKNNKIDSLYYSINDGIVGFKTKKGKSWFLYSK